MDIRTARLEIAKVLAQLERDTGTVCRSIGLYAFDVTNIKSNASEHQMSVEIELERIPGHNWYTGEQS